jgi:hypothetical protein
MHRSRTSRRGRSVSPIAGWLCLLLAAGPLVAAGPVRVVGIRLVGPGLGANGTELQAFREQPGLTLALAVEAPSGKSVIEVDDDGCVVDSLTDDRGTNLLESVDWGPFPETTEDGRHALIELRARPRPAAGASKVRAKGSLALKVAAGIESEKVADLALSAGKKLETRRGTLELVEVAGEDEGATLTFGATKQILDELKDIRFLGADGQPIEIWGRGSMTMGSAVQLEYVLREKPAKVTVELDWWQGLEDVRVPFEVEVGLGLTE